MGFGLELEIDGNNEGIVAALRETNTEYAKTGTGAVKQTDAMAAAAERAGRSVTNLSRSAAGMAAQLQSSSVVAVRGTAAQANELARVSSAAERAQPHVSAYAEAMEFAAEAQDEARAAAAAEAAQLSRTTDTVEGYAKAMDRAQDRVRAYTAELGLSTATVRTSQAVFGTMQERLRAYAGAVEVSTTAATTSHTTFGSRVAIVYEGIKARVDAMRGRVVTSFEAVRAKVRTVASDISASWQTTIDKMGPERYVAACQRMGDASEDLQRRVSRAWKTIAVSTAALTTASFIVGASFEQSMARVGSTVGATEADLLTMSSEAKRWGNTTSFSAAQVAQAMALIGEEVGTTAEVMSSIGPVITLAGATHITLAESVDVVSQAMDSFGLKGTDTARIVNVLTAAAEAGSTGLGSFRSTLSKISSDAGLAGLSLEQTSTILAAMAAHGVTSRASVTALRTLLVGLQNPTDELRALMGGLTIEQNGVYAVIQKLISQGPKLTEALGNKNAFAALTALTREGPAGLARIEASLNGSSRAAEKFAQNQLAVQARFLALKNTVTGIMVDAFEQLSGSSARAIESMRAGLERYRPVIVGAVITVRDFITEHKDLIVTAAKVVAVIAGIGFVVGSIIVPLKLLMNAWTTVSAVMTVARTVGVFMVPVFQAIAGGALRVVLALAGLAGWPALIGVAAAALVAFGVHMYRTNETFRNAIRSILDAAKSFGQFLFDIMTWPVRKIVEVFDKGLAFIGKIFPGMEGAVRSSMEAIKGVAGNVWEGVGDAAEKAFDWTKDRAIEAKDAIGGAAGAVQGAWEGSFLNIGGAADKLFGDLRNKALAAQGLMTEPQSKRALPAEEGAARAGDSSAGAASRANKGSREGGQANAAALAGMVGANLAAFAQIEDAHRASLINQAALVPIYTNEGLAAREALIMNSYAHEVAAAEGSAARIAELTIQRDSDLTAARIANQEAVYQHWMETHDVMALAIGGLSAAYDTAVDLIIRAETNLKTIRESLWMSFKRSFITGAAQMFKAYIGEQIKASIVSNALHQKEAASRKFTEAKIGGVKAYQAFAAIPIIGPALGAAAAAAAFAFLIAFHSGGFVSRFGGAQNGNERIARLEVGEYVVRRQAVDRLGTNTLDYVNRTGQMPMQASGGPSFPISVHINGDSRVDRGKVRAFVEDEIVPLLEDAHKNGRFRLA